MSELRTSYAHLQPDSIIHYVLLPSNQPTQPLREWKGSIKRVVSTGMVLVESLEQGYEGLTEFVLLSQIVAVYKA